MGVRLLKTLAVFWSWLSAALIVGVALSGQAPVDNTAPTQFSDYTAAVVGYVLLIGFLVSLLLIGGILIVNLGLMSKRPEDQVGGRAPSDLGFLKGNAWPPAEEPERRSLPAEEDEEQLLHEQERREKRRRLLQRLRRRNRKPAA